MLIQDMQDHWNQLPSQGQVPIEEKEKQWNYYAQQQPKKKRSGGSKQNLRRFRKACRGKGLTEQKIKMLIEMHKANESMQQSLNHQNANGKHQQEDASTWNSSSTINGSIDKNQNQFNQYQTTLNDHLLNRPTTTTTTTMIPCSISIQLMKVPQSKKFKYGQLVKDDWRQISKLAPNYNRLSPDAFKQLILKTISTTDHYQVQQCLVHGDLLQCIRRLVHLWCQFFQLKIEQDYWNYVDNVNIPIMTWLSEDSSKDIIQQNSIDWDAKKTKSHIEHQKTLVYNKLQQTQNNLSKHLHQLSSKFDLPRRMDIKNSIDIVFKEFAVILRNDLNPFYMHFEQKKLLLHVNIHDAYLVKSFYDLNPTEEQIHTVQQVWRTKLNSCARVLHEKTKKKYTSIFKLLKTDRIVHDNNAIVDMDQDTLNMSLFAIDDFIPVMCAIIEARLANIEQRTQLILKFINTPSSKK